MQKSDIGILVIVVIAAFALIIFLVVRNRKDRQELWPPSGTGDATSEEKMNQHREQDKR